MSSGLSGPMFKCSHHFAYRPSVGDEDGATEGRIPMLFQSLEGHSALHLLHHCTKLAELDMNEVSDVLTRKVLFDTEGINFFRVIA